MSPSIIRKCSHFSGPTDSRTSSRLLCEPVEKLSRPTTVCPSRNRVSSRLEPINPATPVTNQVLGCFGSRAVSSSYAFILMGPLDRLHRAAPHPGPLPSGRGEGGASSGHERSPCYGLLSREL